MTLRIVAALLLVALLALQYRLWVSPNGVRDLWRSEAAIERSASSARSDHDSTGRPARGWYCLGLRPP